VNTSSLENLHVINWPTPKVLAFSTTRYPPVYKKTVDEENVSNNFLLKKSTMAQKNPSSGFDYFNLGMHVGDCPLSVKDNRNTLLAFLPNNTKIQWLEQVHGNGVVYVNEYNSIPYVADAAITCDKNIALAIMTADCLPILLADKNGKEVAAIHGGWRPLATNIIQKTIDNMSTSVDEILAWLGPCIGAQSFEVGEEVRNQFIELSTSFSAAFSPLNTDSSSNQKLKFLADLTMIAQMQLKKLGVENITLTHSNTNACTYTESYEYYSFRREGITGRMASIITLV